MKAAPIPELHDPVQPTNALVKSANRVTDILELLAEQTDGLTLSEISVALRVPLSSMHALVNTLIIKGYLRREDGSQRYLLGPKLPQITAQYQSRLDLYSLAAPLMDQLVALTGESLFLTRLDGNQITFLKVHPGLGMIKIINEVGTHLPAFACGSGKAMLAHLPEADLDQIYPDEKLPALLPASIQTKQELKQTLQAIRRQGYALDVEEAERGVWAMASCIRAGNGRPLAALAIGAPSFRISPENIETWSKALVQRTHILSLKFGYQESILTTPTQVA